MRNELKVGGRRLTWLETGAGEPLVLLHAFPLSADMWAPQIADPPPGWRLIAPDLRGFGEAEATPDFPSLSVDDYAADVVDLLDALKIREAVIGGLSMGGYITFALMRLARQYFRGLVLADTKSTADTDAGRAGRMKMRALADERGPAGIADEMLPKLLSDVTREHAPHVVSDVRALIEGNTSTGIKSALTAMMTRPDSTPLLASFHRPTLILVGEHDGLTPVADSEALHRNIPGSTLDVLPGAGHLSNLEAPEAFNAALSRFLGSKV